MRLKEDATIVVVGEDCEADRRLIGIIAHDTRFLRDYRWQVDGLERLSSDPIENRLVERYARIGADRRQTLDLRRELAVLANGLDDRWIIINTTAEPQEIELRLIVEGDFRDLFASLFSDGEEQPVTANEQRLAGRRLLEATSSDDVRLTADIGFAEADEELVWRRRLDPRQTVSASVGVRIAASNDQAIPSALPSYAEWQEKFAGLSLADRSRAAVLSRAIDDLRTLLLATPFGPYPAAGMPWFGNKFGRDALITGMMLLDWAPEVLSGVLRLLGDRQGEVDDPFREEEPGKILHEIREGEAASRTGRIPFARYYGSVDSTALFVMALDAHDRAAPDAEVAKQLHANLLRALDWLVAHQEKTDGLVHFKASGSGLVVQSWKDSADSMNHADGRAAEQPLAVAEVQGYTYAAFLGGARLCEKAGDTERAADLRRRADFLAGSFHKRYWMEDHGTYAMALDKQGRPLAVKSSDAGHLLWCGIVPEDVAHRLVETLIGKECWSGWGLRTLSSAELRYAPSSCHNGSVWPHDTALFGLGLHRYGFTDELRIVAEALFDLAAAMPHGRIPELVSGHAREAGVAPAIYPKAASPQAWAAASLPLLATLAGLDR